MAKFSITGRRVREARMVTEMMEVLPKLWNRDIGLEKERGHSILAQLEVKGFEGEPKYFLLSGSWR